MWKKFFKLSNVKTIGVFVVYIDTGTPVLNIPSKSRGLADENKKVLTEWKWFQTLFTYNHNVSQTTGLYSS
jgi:hypothetical protein